MHKMMATELPLMEAFFTVQGEGVHAGTAAYFIRLAGCDVGCVWCDVKESWDASSYPVVSVQTMAEDAQKSGAQLVVITGGEPAMYDLTALCQALRERGLVVHIETSAAHEIRGQFDWVTLSPKKFKAPLPAELQKADELKIIVFNKSDFEWAETYADQVPNDCVLLLQPEWDKRETMAPLLVDYVKAHPQWRISLQTHKILHIP
jgi:7-carboxy-7-deazaguanine synthase